MEPGTKFFWLWPISANSILPENEAYFFIMITKIMQPYSAHTAKARPLDLLLEYLYKQYYY